MHDGRLSFYTRYLSDAAEFDTLNIPVDKLSKKASGLVYRLMQECELMLFPWPSPPVTRWLQPSTATGRT